MTNHDETNDVTDEPIARAYLLDDEERRLYDDMDQPDRDNFDDFVNELEHYMVQLRELLPRHEAVTTKLISSIWDNTRDLTGED